MHLDAFLHYVTQSSREGFMVADRDGIVLHANATACAILGCEPGAVAGRPVAQIVDGAARVEAAEASAVWTAGVVTLSGARGAGLGVEVAATRFHHADGSIAGFAYAMRDGAAADNAETSTELPPHGAAQIAAGFAHDFDNILAIASGHLQIAEMLAGNAAVRESIKQALLACVMGSRMTQRLKTLARPLDATPVRIDVNAVVGPLVKAVMAAFENSIRVQLALTKPSPVTVCDRSGLECALMNLLLNGIDAMPVGGRLTVSTARVGSGFVTISVEDSGVGMAEHIAARAFEPFFSTKPAGSHSGLGLASVAAFANGAGGRAQLSSRIGAGTRVTITLPAAV